MVRNIYQSVYRMSQYTMVSFVFTLLLLGVFYYQIGMQNSTAGLVYAMTIPAYYYLLVLVATLALLPFYFVPYFNIFIVVPKVLLDTFLLADIVVFNIYRFHVDFLYINMAIHDFNGFGFSAFSIAVAIIALIVIVSLNLYVYARIRRREIAVSRRTNIAMAGILLVFLAGQVTHVWAFENKIDYITRYTPMFPYYRPITSGGVVKELNRDFPWLVPDIADNPDPEGDRFTGDASQADEGILNYPKKPITLDARVKYKRPNILFFVVESWRADMMNAAVTPNISKVAETGMQFNNHYSGGNATAMGLYSLMYGIHPSYLKYTQAMPYAYRTEFIKTLEKLDYEVSSYTTTDLDRFGLKPMFFGDIAFNRFVYKDNLSHEDNDRQVVERLLFDIREQDEQKPWFKFVFLTSSHHSYYYPPEYEKFTPVERKIEAYLIDKTVDPTPYLNNYKNALYFIDALFGDIMSALVQRKFDDNTLIVITADHGEEFNDNKSGYWGHGGNYTKFQTAVPLIIRVPGKHAHSVIAKRSSHVDIVPTVMKEFLHVRNNIADFSSGYDLFQLPETHDLVFTGYSDKAYLIGDTVYESGYPARSYNLDDVFDENTAFDIKAIEQLKINEYSFLHSS